MRVYARIFENMLVYAFMRYMLIQNKYKLCFNTFLLTLLLILMYNFNFEKYAFVLAFPSLVITVVFKNSKYGFNACFIRVAYCIHNLEHLKISFNP